MPAEVNFFKLLFNKFNIFSFQIIKLLNIYTIINLIFILSYDKMIPIFYNIKGMWINFGIIQFSIFFYLFNKLSGFYYTTKECKKIQ